MPTPFNMNVSAIGTGSVSLATFAASAIAPMNIGNITSRADKVLPQTATETLFTVTVAPIWLFHIYGQVGTVIQAQADTMKLQVIQTGQVAVDMCATLDLNAAAALIYLGITGTAANAAVKGFGLPIQATAWLVPVGTISLITSASNTGTARWVAHWAPAEAGGLLVAS
jgi:hypothetical protein